MDPRLRSRCRLGGGRAAHARAHRARGAALAVLPRALARPRARPGSAGRAAGRRQARAHGALRRLARRARRRLRRGVAFPRGPHARRHAARRQVRGLEEQREHRRAGHLPAGSRGAGRLRRAARARAAGGRCREPLRVGTGRAGRPRRPGRGDGRPFRERRVVGTRAPRDALARRAGVRRDRSAPVAGRATERVPAGVPRRLPDDARAPRRRAARRPAVDRARVRVVGRRAPVRRAAFRDRAGVLDRRRERVRGVRVPEHRALLRARRAARERRLGRARTRRPRLPAGAAGRTLPHRAAHEPREPRAADRGSVGGDRSTRSWRRSRPPGAAPRADAARERRQTHGAAIPRRRRHGDRVEVRRHAPGRVRCSSTAACSRASSSCAFATGRRCRMRRRASPRSS